MGQKGGESNSDTIRLVGIYQGKSLYLSTASETGCGLGIKELWVNGKKVADDNCGTTFEIDLSCFGISIGDSVILEIVSWKSCHPKVVNPEVLQTE